MASIGDVASMIITVQNRTDSIRVDNVRVVETPPAALDFASGDGVTFDGRTIAWNAGTLAPGESRSTTVRFVVNSRESKGWARVTDVTRIDRIRGGYEVRGRLVVEGERNRGRWNGGYDRYGNNYDRYGNDYDKGKFACVVRYGDVQDVRLSGLRGYY